MFEEVPEQLKIADHIRRTPYYDDCKIYIDGVFEIANKFQLSLKDLPSAESLSPAMRPAFQAMLGLVAQNLRSLILIAKAASEGFAEDAEVITRVMWERHLSVSLISLAPAKRGVQYLRSGAINLQRWLEQSQDPRSVLHLDALEKDAERIRSEADKFMKDYFPQKKRPPRYWHGMTIVEVAEAAGLKVEHELGYGFSSEYSHAQGYSISLNPAATPSEVVRNQPLPVHLRSTVSVAMAWFLRGWGALAKAFQPGELDQIKTLLRHHAKTAFPDVDREIEL